MDLQVEELLSLLQIQFGAERARWVLLVVELGKDLRPGAVWGTAYRQDQCK